MIPGLPAGFSHPMQIGEGAFGSVYRVRQHLLDRKVALKIIYEKDHRLRAGYLKEARVQAQIKADCVPQIFDAFEWKQSVCIVMQWIKGISLTNVLKIQHGTEEKTTIASGVIHALARLHSLGFAHRDIKPENILIDSCDGIYLVDFGFTKNISEVLHSSSSHARGTPAYMAPEVWNSGDDVDLMRADVYSLGMVLRQILDGCEAVAFTDQLVEKKPENRPQSAREIQKLWEKSQWNEIHAIEWKRIVEKNSTCELSEKLSAAAWRLITAKRYDEAYELLLESLEENPDNSDAIDLMSRFSTIARRKSIPLMTYSVGACALIGAIVASYFAGIYSGKNDQMEILDDEIKVLLKVDESQDVSVVLPFRNNKNESGHLNGSIIIDKSECKEFGGTIFVDTIAYNDFVDYKKKVDLNSGPHIIICQDNIGNVLYRESVNLLPFQTKRVTLPSLQKGVQSK